MANSPKIPGGVVRHEHIQQLRAGPIPEASELERYEKVLPGLADRIMTMAENEASSRQKLFSEAQAASIANEIRGRTERRIGQFCALLLAGLAMTLGYLAAISGMQTFGTVIGGSAIVTLCIAFLTGQNPSRMTQS